MTTKKNNDQKPDCAGHLQQSTRAAGDDHGVSQYRCEDIKVAQGENIPLQAAQLLTLTIELAPSLSGDDLFYLDCAQEILTRLATQAAPAAAGRGPA